jgi:hypothetical protein
MTETGPRSTFFDPLWRRLAIIAAVAGWLAFEVFYTREELWIFGAGMMLVYGIWQFLVKWPTVPPDQGADAP